MPLYARNSHSINNQHVGEVSEAGSFVFFYLLLDFEKRLSVVIILDDLWAALLYRVLQKRSYSPHHPSNLAFTLSRALLSLIARSISCTSQKPSLLVWIETALRNQNEDLTIEIVSRNSASVAS